jgi:hypothetical protein
MFGCVNEHGRQSMHNRQRWTTALREAEELGVFLARSVDEEHRPPSMRSRLLNLAQESVPPDVAKVTELLGQIASFSIRVDDWAQPYEPLWSVQHGRTALPADLTPDGVEILKIVAPLLPDPLLRARVSDVIGLLSSGKERTTWFAAELAAVIEAGVHGSDWHQVKSSWDRALLVAARFKGAFRSEIEDLSRALTSHVLSAGVQEHPGAVADLLLKHKLARHEASAIANHMRTLANETKREDSDESRNLHRRAAEWYRWAGDQANSDSEHIAIVTSLIREAETLDSTEQSGHHVRSGYLYERALKELRRIPRSQRKELGGADPSTELAGRIRAAGVATLSTMGVFESDGVDVTEWRRQSVVAVTGRDPIGALRALVSLVSLPAYQNDKEAAQSIIADHPLQSFFSNIHYSNDGRIIHKSAGQGGEPIYDTDPSTWRQMIQTFEFRMALEVQGSLHPAWLAVSNEHRLSISDFFEISRQSSLVPADREALVARALFYGYDGDFMTAAQLLAPQMEHFVRLHLRNAGHSTTTVDSQGIENEIGLSALMAKTEVNSVFGEDLSYAVRALFCGPIGPNLRNEFAHGLMNDASLGAVQLFYCWWFMLRLVFVPFWNRMHDTESADAREPS